MAQTAGEAECDEAQRDRDRQQRGKRRDRGPAQPRQRDGGAGEREQRRQQRWSDCGAVERGGVIEHGSELAVRGKVANGGCELTHATMLIAFDTWKDATNFDKHGLPWRLARGCSKIPYISCSARSAPSMPKIASGSSAWWKESCVRLFMSAVAKRCGSSR